VSVASNGHRLLVAGIALASAFQYHFQGCRLQNRAGSVMFQIIEVFLGFSIGIAVLWVTILALVKFTRRVMSGEEWQDVLKDLWKKPLNGVLPANTKTSVSEDSRSNGQARRKNL
jgi:hypothetical protein